MKRIVSALLVVIILGLAGFYVAKNPEHASLDHAARAFERLIDLSRRHPKDFA